VKRFQEPATHYAGAVTGYGAVRRRRLPKLLLGDLFVTALWISALTNMLLAEWWIERDAERMAVGVARDRRATGNAI
jgi:hypothetical protein